MGGNAPGVTYTLNLSGKPDGLYRITVTCSEPMIPYTIKVDGAGTVGQFYCVESTEPYATFNILGNSAHTDPEWYTEEERQPVRQYFFVPKDAGDFYVKLQTDVGGVSKARLQLRKASDNSVVPLTNLNNQSVQYLEVKAGSAETNDPAYFDEGKANITGATNSGTICYFELYDPGDLDVQPKCGLWVRFSRNIPNYFAFQEQRLMVPTVHPCYHNAYYVNTTRTHRAFLCGDRDDLEGYETADLKIKVGTSIESTSSGYVISLSKSNASPVRWYGPTYCGAYLLQTGKPTHWGTDKVDDIMVVRLPTYTIAGEGDWATGWPDPLYLAYDDGNALDRHHVYDDGTTWDDYCDEKIAQENEGLKTRNFHVVLGDDSDKLQYLTVDTTDGWKMKALGALFAGNMSTHFSSNPNDSRVLIWYTFDEPITGGTALKDLYDEYWNRCATTNRPILINLSLAYAMEDCIGAMDILCSDPYTDVHGRHRNVIKDYIKASKAVRSRAEVGSKRLAIVIWGYYHPKVQEPSNAGTDSDPNAYPRCSYADDHGIVKGDEDIDIIGMFTYCRGGGGENTRLPNQNYAGDGGAHYHNGPANGEDLWDEIQDLNTARQ